MQHYTQSSVVVFCSNHCTTHNNTHYIAIISTYNIISDINIILALSTRIIAYFSPELFLSIIIFIQNYCYHINLQHHIRYQYRISVINQNICLFCIIVYFNKDHIIRSSILTNKLICIYIVANLSI